MVTVRGSLAKRNAGGPQFKYIPQRIVVEVGDGTSISDIANSADDITDKLIDNLPVEDTLMSEVQDKLNELDFKTRVLSNTGVIVAEAERLSTVIENIRSFGQEISDRTLQKLDKLEQRAQNGDTVSLIDSFRPGLFNFQDSSSRELEAGIRNDLLGSITNPVTDAIEDLRGVVRADVSYAVNTPGPRNLGLDVASSTLDFLDDDSSKPDVGDAVKKIKGEKAWQVSTGSNAVVAIFDTSFSKQFVQSNRVIDTFHGDDVDTAYSKPEEGHGTMTAYSAAGNAEETSDGEGGQKVKYSGVAKNADLLLARLTDSSGAMVYTEEAWDWLAGWVKTLDKPVISNHSYGIPLCSARSQNLCSSIQANISEALSSRSDHQAVYAAGNEAQYCGHRLSGLTNAISGANSKPSSIAVAAFRYEGKSAQTYSSHGYGTCGPVTQNPKPDVGCLLPSVVPYGNKEKDLSTNDGGSGAGTSEAAPLTAGVAALIASITGNARRETIEGILESTAKLPRMTQVNTVTGHDARFGHGQINADSAVRKAKILEEQKPPNAVFTYEPEQPTVGDEITFDASASTDPNEDIESYDWDFGDGTTATGEQVSHTFEEFGSNSVILTVTDSTNSQDSFSQEVTVNAKPDAQFEIEPEAPTVNETVTVDASSTTDPDGDVVEYEWGLGDGSSAKGETIQFQYNDTGDYTVQLTVTDSVGILIQQAPQ
ncbi:MAG: subtilisin-like serine protease [Candidatus Nanosalina sp. J07AB43]|nr:MAG: subtilisin-like serine protease [Candidatus Nanosalina sp. J07AB43]